jgi:hypothetical protein
MPRATLRRGHDIEAASGAAFFDGFESGDFSGDNGIVVSWGGVVRGGVDDFSQGGGMSVSSTNPRTGTYAMRHVHGGGGSGVDSNNQKMFVFDNTYPELWLEYYIFIPPNYVHRNDVGADNNKWFDLWGYGDWPGPAAGHMLVQLQANPKGGTGPLSIMQLGWSDEDNALAEPGSWAWPDDEPVGAWNRLRYHVRVASDAVTADGQILLAWSVEGGTNYGPVIDVAVPMFHGTPIENGFSNGWLGGYHSSGYAEDTVFDFDDFSIYTADPGWGY